MFFLTVFFVTSSAFAYVTVGEISKINFDKIPARFKSQGKAGKNSENSCAQFKGKWRGECIKENSRTAELLEIKQDSCAAIEILQGSRKDTITLPSTSSFQFSIPVISAQVNQSVSTVAMWNSEKNSISVVMYSMMASPVLTGPIIGNSYQTISMSKDQTLLLSTKSTIPGSEYQEDCELKRDPK